LKLTGGSINFGKDNSGLSFDAQTALMVGHKLSYILVKFNNLASNNYTSHHTQVLQRDMWILTVAISQTQDLIFYDVGARGAFTFFREFGQELIDSTKELANNKSPIS
jgi:hypothetical protein